MATADSWIQRTVGWAAAGVVMLAGLWVLSGSGTLGLAEQLPGSQSFGGLSQAQLLAVALALGVGIYIVATSGSELSIPFLLTGVALVMLVWSVLPASVQTALPLDSLAPAGLSAVTFAALTGVAVVAYYAVTNRAGSGAKTGSTVAKRTQRDIQRLVGEWAQTIRWLTVGVIASIAVVLGQGAPVVGELFNQIAQAPLVVANVIAIGLGYLGLSGQLLQDPRLYAIVTTAALVLALGVKYEDAN